MKIKLFFRAVFSPRASLELATGGSGLAAVVANAVNGVLIATLFMLPLKSFAAAPLMLLMAVLYGSFAGLIISTVYPRIEFLVGRRLGGKGSLDDLCRIFAWSFLPVGIICALCWSVTMLLPANPEDSNLLFYSCRRGQGGGNFPVTGLRVGPGLQDV